MLFTYLVSFIDNAPWEVVVHLGALGIALVAAKVILSNKAVPQHRTN